jgi:hypothetical protein
VRDAEFKDAVQELTRRYRRLSPAKGAELIKVLRQFSVFVDLKQGIRHMEEGLALLNQQPADGFTIRAMRKLAYGYARAGRVVSALDLSNDAYDLAMKRGAYDQIGRVERLAHWIDRGRGGRS